VNECGGLQRVMVNFSAQTGRCDAAKFLVDEWYQPFFS